MCPVQRGRCLRNGLNDPEELCAFSTLPSRPPCFRELGGSPAWGSPAWGSESGLLLDSPFKELERPETRLQWERGGDDAVLIQNRQLSPKLIKHDSTVPLF